MKNRFAAMTLAGIMAAALFAGCGGKNDSDTASKSASAPVAQSSAAEQAQSSAEEVKVQPVAVDAAWYGEMDRPDKTEADGSIADWFLFGQYKSVYFDGSDGCDKRIFDEIPDMTFHTGETNHVLSRAVSSVPVAMTCGRATSLGKDTTWLHTRDDWAALNGRLQAEHPEDADALLENIVELYNTPLADMSLIGEDGAVYNRFRYTYTVEGNVMTCRQVRGLKDDFTLEYYEDAEPQVYNLRFENDSLVMENVNGGTVTLLPQQKWAIARGEGGTYDLTGSIIKDEDAFMNIIDVSLNWNDTKGTTVGLPVLHFLDGTQTDLEAEAFLTGENEVTVNWNSIVEVDGTVVDGPGSITFRFLNAGSMMDPSLIILDEEGNAYPYLAWYDDYMTNHAAQ